MRLRFSVRITKKKRKLILKPPRKQIAGISNHISLTHRSVIEEIFKFRVDTVQGEFTFFAVSKQPQKTMCA